MKNDGLVQRKRGRTTPGNKYEKYRFVICTLALRIVFDAMEGRPSARMHV
jgi:hypothetical protein